jgi:hypothetical protein
MAVVVLDPPRQIERLLDHRHKEEEEEEEEEE